MSKEKVLPMLLGILNTFSDEYNNLKGLSMEEMIIAADEKIINMSILLSLEIRDLIDEGYKEEEIINLIENIQFNEEDNLNQKEQEYLKKDAKKTLKKIKYREKEKNKYE